VKRPLGAHENIAVNFKFCELFKFWRLPSKYESAKTEFDKSEVVLIVEAKSVENELDPDDGYNISGKFFTLEVIENLKGKTPKTIVTYSENSSGRYDFEVGSKHLIFISSLSAPVEIDNCGFSNELSKSLHLLSSLK
jgi:hypothetical protein